MQQIVAEPQYGEPWWPLYLVADEPLTPGTGSYELPPSWKPVVVEIRGR
jgi:hypothetical protein